MERPPPASTVRSCSPASPRPSGPPAPVTRHRWPWPRTSTPCCWARERVRPVHIIANPAAAGGRPGRAIPVVRARLEALGIEYRLEVTRDLDHARELARTAT